MVTGQTSTRLVQHVRPPWCKATRKIARYLHSSVSASIAAEQVCRKPIHLLCPPNPRRPTCRTLFNPTGSVVHFSLPEQSHIEPYLPYGLHCTSITSGVDSARVPPYCLYISHKNLVQQLVCGGLCVGRFLHGATHTWGALCEPESGWLQVGIGPAQGQFQTYR